jgi:hypothetical protein
MADTPSFARRSSRPPVPNPIYADDAGVPSFPSRAPVLDLDENEEVSESDVSQQLDPDEPAGQLSSFLLFSCYSASSTRARVSRASDVLLLSLAVESKLLTIAKKDSRDAAWTKIQERINRDTGVKFSSKTLRLRLNKLVDGSALPHKDLTGEERTTAKEFGRFAFFLHS